MAYQWIPLVGNGVNNIIDLSIISGDIQELQGTWHQTGTNIYSSGGADVHLSGDLITNSDILPTVHNTQSIGASGLSWKDVWIGPGSLYVNNKQVIYDDSSTITVSTSANQDLVLKTTANGTLRLESAELITLDSDQGITLSVPSGLAAKHVQLDTSSVNGNIAISALGTNGQVQLYSIDEIDLTCATLDINATTIDWGTSTFATFTISATAADPTLNIKAVHSSAFDPKIDFYTDDPATKKFSLGVDGTDDTFRIEVGTGTLGTRNDFVLGTAGMAGFGAANSTSNTRIYGYQSLLNPGVAETVRNYYALSLINVTDSNAPSVYLLQFDGIGNPAAGKSIAFQAGGRGASYSAGSGTIADLRAWDLYFGNYGTYYGRSPATSEAHGLVITPYRDGGTITYSFDLKINSPGPATSTVTYDYCIYSAHNAPSYLLGKLHVGSNSDPGIASDMSVTNSSTYVRESLISTTNACYLALSRASSTYNNLIQWWSGAGSID
ncbi:hypothetical protein EHM76_05280, partial [bacterium]